MSSMNSDLRWLAINAPDWNNNLDRIERGPVGVDWFSSESFPGRIGFSREELRVAKAELSDERMDIIGHNGGTGDHYEAPASKYHVLIKGQWVDVYDILSAYGVTNPADAHAIKKMLCPGQRGAKDGIQDRQEAIVSLQRAIELEGGL